MNKVGSTVVFIHDHCFLRGPDGVTYSEGKITDGMIERLRPLAESVVIISRMRGIQDATGLIPLTDPCVRMAPVRGIGFSRVFGISLLVNLMHLWREIGRGRVVVLRLPCLLSVLAAPVIWLRSVPYAVEVVGFPLDGLRGKGDGLAVRAVGKLLHFLTARLTAHAVGALYVTRNALQDVFPTKGISAAASNVELPLPPVDIDENDIRALHNPIRIGLIGGMSTNYKGIDVAIQAIAALLKGGYACNLHILGSGDAEPFSTLACELGCPDAVFFDGIRQGGVGVADWLDGLDIYIQPSRTEGLPRALIEAMARGLPAIASNVGGIPELLDDCWLIPPGAPDMLAGKLQQMIDDDTFREQARKANACRAIDYSGPVLRDRRNDFYMSLARSLGR